MEGLIPMLYKAIKKSRTRRQYECLSSGTVSQTYNISEFYVLDGGSSSGVNYSSSSTQSQKNHMKSSHRRHSSLGDYAFGFSTPENRINRPEERDVMATTTPRRARLVRFRSHRMFMFSCVGGAA
ncbi:hypothetical protein PanWU01x14_095920 [Parasponia andersonii]|uniref:Uncharacterized protein n=1 Tax=Parasponia andersonii TaxID=3476 RepID=A0A2P5D564_PARAD|nr:hypothetical protein PanWU01x14_095920 [Parasponia andersonii]